MFLNNRFQSNAQFIKSTLITFLLINEQETNSETETLYKK